MTFSGIFGERYAVETAEAEKRTTLAPSVEILAAQKVHYSTNVMKLLIYLERLRVVQNEVMDTLRRNLERNIGWCDTEKVKIYSIKSCYLDTNIFILSYLHFQRPLQQ